MEPQMFSRHNALILEHLFHANLAVFVNLICFPINVSLRVYFSGKSIAYSSLLPTFPFNLPLVYEILNSA